MSGKKEKKPSKALSTSTPVNPNPGTVIAHSDCTCKEELTIWKRIVHELTANLQLHVANSNRLGTYLDELDSRLLKVTDYVDKFPPHVIITKAQHESDLSDMEKRLTELQSTTKSRLALIETSLAQLRISVTENLKSIKTPAYQSLPAPVDRSYLNSSIEVGLRNLNKRIRKNNVVLHGLDPSMQDCVSQAEEFFLQHLKLKLPIQHAYRLGSTTTTGTVKKIPLLVVFPSLHHKLELFKNCNLLAGTPFSIQDDLSAEERRERSRKLELYKSYKSQKKKVVFRGCDLYVDGQLIQC